MRTPSARCFPHNDPELEADVASAITLCEGRLDAATAVLRVKYPAVRIVPRVALAAEDGATVWYCFRDGRVIAGHDGVGAMRAWTRMEACTNQALDLIEWSAELIERTQSTLSAASFAVGARSRGRNSG